MPTIPAHAKRVFQGIVFDVYQWEQELFDGSKATFEMVKRPNTTVVIPLDNKGNVFYSLQEQPGKKPFSGLFGGRSEEGEEPLVAAKRELLEEAGLESSDWSQLMVVEPASKTDWKVFYFVAKNCRKVANQNLDSGERLEVKTASVDEFLTTIIQREDFGEFELKQKVMSALNAKIVAELKEKLA